MNVKRRPVKRRVKLAEQSVRENLDLKKGVLYEPLMQTETFRPSMTYRDYIEREFRRRCRRNSQYSLRAFARDMEISPSKLSEVMRRKCGLSAGAAEELSRNLKLTDMETQHFIVLVEAEHSRNSVRKSQAREQLASFQAHHGFSEIDLEKFKVISEWYHLALLELMELATFQHSIEWMAEQLELEIFVVAEALDRLENFGLLVLEEGKYRPTGDNLSVPGGIPSREIVEYHLQMMGKSFESVEHGKMSDRDVSHMVIAIDKADYPKAQEFIKKFRREFATSLQTTAQNKNAVYALGMQFFPLTTTKEPS